MDKEKKDEIVFWVAKYWIKDQLDKNRAYVDKKYILDKLNVPGLEDARCLWRMIIKEVDAHNVAIKSKVTLLNNFRYNSKWRSSKLFDPSGIRVPPYKKIDQLIEENPGKDYFDIYQKIREID